MVTYLSEASSIFKRESDCNSFNILTEAYQSYRYL